MRALPALALTTMLLTTPTVSNAAMSEQTLDGWKQLRLGMSPEQVRGLPPSGKPWTSAPALAPVSQITTLTSLGPIHEFGFEFDMVGATFKGEQGLVIISLSSQKRGTSGEDCNQSYLKLLPAVEARYGSFAALGYGLPPGSTVKIRAVEGGKSQYRLADTPQGYRMEAVRTFGTRYISVRTAFVGSKENPMCFTDVWFQQPEPD